MHFTSHDAKYEAAWMHGTSANEGKKGKEWLCNDSTDMVLRMRRGLAAVMGSLTCKVSLVLINVSELNPIGNTDYCFQLISFWMRHLSLFKDNVSSKEDVN